MTKVLGILNLTRDSFSDGGRFLLPAAAVAHGLKLLEDGADFVDVGAESSHPDAEDVPADEEIARLRPVVEALVRGGAEVAIDTVKPAVMAVMADVGARWWNDVAGLRQPGAVEFAARSAVGLFVMYSRAASPRAVRSAAAPPDVLAAIEGFFDERLRTLAAAGVDRSRVVLDPGMGFFLAAAPAPSLQVLRELPRLRARFGLPLLVSVTRKSFLGALTGRAVAERGAATLAAELWAASHGADYVRTHDPRALRDGLAVWNAIAAAGDAVPAVPYNGTDR